MSLAAAALASVAFLHAGNLVVLDPATGAQKVVLRHATAPVRRSGDGRLVSAGGRVAGGPAELQWAPAGETAAYRTRAGAVVVWSPRRGRRTVVPASWGATSIAWGAGGRLALGRQLLRPGKPPTHQEVWVWRAGTLRRVVGPLPRNPDRTPIVDGFAPDGRVLWWDDPYGSASIAADGLTLHADGAPLATTLVYREFVAPCGRSLALAVGPDRNTMSGKSIVVGGRDVSRDRTRSWVSPACSADGSVVVAAGGRTSPSGPWGREHRAIWRLVPARRQLTRPPAGWTDEDPHVLRDGSIVFVRTRFVPHARSVTVDGTLERLAGGRLTRLADLTTTVPDDAQTMPMYFGRYWWPDRLAVAS